MSKLVAREGTNILTSKREMAFTKYTTIVSTYCGLMQTQIMRKLLQSMTEVRAQGKVMAESPQPTELTSETLTRTNSRTTRGVMSSEAIEGKVTNNSTTPTVERSKSVQLLWGKVRHKRRRVGHRLCQLIQNPAVDQRIPPGQAVDQARDTSLEDHVR